MKDSGWKLSFKFPGSIFKLRALTGYGNIMWNWVDKIEVLNSYMNHKIVFRSIILMIDWTLTAIILVLCN